MSAVAAPLNFSPLSVAADPAARAQIFDRTEVLTAARAGLQVAVLLALVPALQTLPSAPATARGGQ